MSQTITIKGTVTRTPELRYTKTQKPILTIPVAVNRSVKAQDGSWTNDLDFYVDLTLWDDKATQNQGVFQKGDRVIAEGPIRLSAYIDKQGAAQPSITVSPKKLGLEVSYGLPDRFANQPQQPQPQYQQQPQQPQYQPQQQQWAQPDGFQPTENEPF